MVVLRGWLPEFPKLSNSLENKLRILTLALREKCPCSELFWSIFSPTWTEYGEILRISPYSVRMWENADQNNFEHGHFLRSVELRFWTEIKQKNQSLVKRACAVFSFNTYLSSKSC